MESYFALAGDSTSLGNEVVNSARLAAYLEAGYGPPGVNVSACTFCPGLPDALACEGDDGQVEPVRYTYPSDPANPAPWYDPKDPESGNFAGVLVLDIEGWDTANFTRTVTDRIGDGAVLGRGRYQPRQFVVTALLIGKTCCSLRSGLRWLTSTLRDACGPCNGAELDYFECCPGSSGTCDTSDEPGTPEGFAHARRTMRQVGLTDGVRVTEKVGRACGRCKTGCAYMQVEFTLTAGDPYSYGEPVCPIPRQPIADGTYEDCVDFNIGAENCDDPCDVDPCPAQDPRCPVPPSPPDIPLPIGCGCEPIYSRGSCTTIAAEDVPDWQEAVPLITIYAGSSPLRGVKITFYENPMGLPADDLDDCRICTAFYINYLEAGATMTIDGRDRRFRVACAGRPEANGSRLVSGVGNRPFTWPVFSCATDMTVCVTADATTLADDATYEVCFVPRSAA